MSTEHGGGAHPKRAWLEGLIRDGSIDTLVVALTDMQGRLMGKRVQGQAFLGGVDRPRRPLLHLPAGHRHGDEHAGRVRADELGDRLRRLDRGPGVGHPAGRALAGEDGHRAVRHGRPSRRRDPGLAPHHAEARRGTCHEAMGFRRQGRLRARVLPADRYLRAGLAQGLRRPRALRLLQRGLPPAAGHEGRADPRQAAQPDDRRPASRSSSARARRRPASTRSTSATTTSWRWPTARCSSSTAPRRSPT